MRTIANWFAVVGSLAAWVGACGGGHDSCPQGTTKCGAECIDARASADNCGACGTRCANGEVCSQGQCALSCGGGTQRCGTSCVDARSDAQNCGACGKACKAGEVCSKGQCALSCGGGTHACGAACVDFAIDAAHCGSCTTACAPGQTCTLGKCALSCGGGTVACGAACVDPKSDPNHCGDCGTVCFGGKGVCAAGLCLPASCMDGIVDGTETDVDCGGNACGKCPDGKACVGYPDCQSAVCQTKICQAPTCQDMTKNGAETDQDCGGGKCTGCAVGKKCLAGGDCASGVCTNNLCKAPTCSDGVTNGGETKLDCGGPCPTCTALLLHLDDGAGLVAADASPNQTNGNVEGTGTWVSGKKGGALFFDKKTRIIVQDPNGKFDLANGMTLSMWVTATTLPQDASPVMKTTSSGWKDGYGIYYDAGALCGYVTHWLMYRACAPFNTTAQFRHVAMTYDGAVLRLYFDGAQAASFATAVGVSQATASLNFGDANANGVYTWNGAIDEIRVYDFAMSAAQVNDLFVNP